MATAKKKAAAATPFAAAGKTAATLSSRYGPKGVEKYTTSQYGTATTPNLAYSLSGNTPFNDYFSPTPTTMASAWGLPQNGGYLRVSSGYATSSKPATKDALTAVQQGVAMVTLYQKFAHHQALTPAELKAAQALGGTIARAAQLLGTTAPAAHQGRKNPAGTPPYTEPERTEPAGAAKKGLSAATKKALTAANREIASRVESTLHVTVATLTPKSLSEKVPKQFASLMQNAGYGVTQNMTLDQALGVVSGPKAETPSNILNSPQTVAQFIRSLTNGQMTSQDIYALQTALWNGGFYDATYQSGQKAFKQGNLTLGTLQAFRNAVEMAGQHNAQHPTDPVTLEQIIKTQDAQMSPMLQAIGQQNAQTAAASFSYATPEQLQGTLESAMESYLGRLPTSGELNSFTSYLDQLEKTGSKAAQEAESPTGLVDYNTGIPYLPKVPTPAQAAETWAQNENPTAFVGQKIANGFGMLMNLIDRQNPSAYTTVGTRPTTMT